MAPRIWVSFLILGLAAASARAEMTATLEAKIAGLTVTEFPLLLDLTITNAGRQPLGYISTGADDYPHDLFTATLVDNRGTSRQIQLSNGGYAKTVLALPPAKP